jgi:hypothetical protein
LRGAEHHPLIAPIANPLLAAPRIFAPGDVAPLRPKIRKRIEQRINDSGH